MGRARTTSPEQGTGGIWLFSALTSSSSAPSPYQMKKLFTISLKKRPATICWVSHPTRRGHCSLFWLRTMYSDLEMLDSHPSCFTGHGLIKQTGPHHLHNPRPSKQPLVMSRSDGTAKIMWPSLSASLRHLFFFCPELQGSHSIP